MIKFGYITELDMSKGMVRVNFTEDDTVSNFLPVSVPASKEDKYSFPFAINEQVWCIMDEQGEFGVVGGAIYSNKDKPPSGASEQKIMINIGASKVQLTIDRNIGSLGIETLGEISLKAPTISIDAPNVNVSGVLTAGTVMAGTVNLATHTHLSGTVGSPTSPPII